MLLSTLGARLLSNMLAGIAKIPGRGVKRAGEGTITAGNNF